MALDDALNLTVRPTTAARQSDSGGVIQRVAPEVTVTGNHSLRLARGLAGRAFTLPSCSKAELQV